MQSSAREVEMAALPHDRPDTDRRSSAPGASNPTFSVKPYSMAYPVEGRDFESDFGTFANEVGILALWFGRRHIEDFQSVPPDGLRLAP